MYNYSERDRDRYTYLNDGSTLYYELPAELKFRIRNRTGVRLHEPNISQIKHLFNYYDGDHWFTSLTRSRIVAFDTKEQVKRARALQKDFVSCNKVKEVVDRHTRALVGKPPSWFFADPTGEALETVPGQLDKQLHSFLTQYERQSQSMLTGFGGKSALEQAIAHAKVCGRGYLRIYNPDYFGIPITIHSPDPTQVFIGRDSNGYPRYVKYTYTDYETDQVLTEHQMVDQSSGLTIFRTLVGDTGRRESANGYYGYEDAEIMPGSEYSLDLGGAYSIYEFKLDSLISLDLQRLQDSYNYILSLMIPNLGDAGFSRQSILNGLAPGAWEENEETHELEYVQKGEFKTNPGSVNFIQGIPVYTDGEITGYTNPQMVTNEPSSVDHFTSSLAAIEENIYRSVQQGFILADSESNLSGVSRDKLEDDFRLMLEKEAMAVQEGISSIYRTVLMMLNMEDQGVLEQIKKTDLSVQLNIYIGKLTAEEVREARENFSAGLISGYTTRMLLGVEDADDEAAKIEEEMQDFGGTPANPLIPDPQDNPNNNTSTSDN